MFKKETQNQIDNVTAAWKRTFKGGQVWKYKEYLSELVILKNLLNNEDQAEVKKLMDSTVTPRATITWREHINKIN